MSDEQPKPSERPPVSDRRSSDRIEVTWSVDCESQDTFLYDPRRPVPTAGLERRLVSRLGHAVKLTAQSIRIRLPDLTIPWGEAVAFVLEAVESTQSRNGVVREPAALSAR